MACSEASEVTYSGPGSSMDFCPLSRPSQNEGSSDSGLPCSCPCSLCSLVKGPVAFRTPQTLIWPRAWKPRFWTPSLLTLHLFLAS
jgi:hypothetical protein